MKLLFVVGALGLVACGGGQSEDIERLEEQVAELQEQLENTTTTGPVGSSTSAVAATDTTSAGLSAAQRVYCDELTSVIAIPTASGGTTNRPETVQFFEIADELGYLDLPYTGLGWGQAVALSPDDFVSTTHTFSGVLNLDIGSALRQEWQRNLDQIGFSLGEAYLAVCFAAWELR